MIEILELGFVLPAFDDDNDEIPFKKFFNKNALKRRERRKREREMQREERNKRLKKYIIIDQKYANYQANIEKWQKKYNMEYQFRYEKELKCLKNQICKETELRQKKNKRMEARKKRFEELLEKIIQKRKKFDKKIQRYEMLECYSDDESDDNSSIFSDQSLDFDELKYRFCF